MTVIRVRLSEADRKEYGADGELLPEVLTVDVEALKDLRARELVALDKELGTPVKLFLEPMRTWGLDAAQLCHTVAFLAVHLAGSPVKFADFDPRLGRAEFEREDDPNPPDGTSASSSGEATPRRSSKR